MKKFLTILLACIMLMVCFVAGTACASVKPEFDLKEAKRVLEKNGYDVDFDDDIDGSDGYYGIAIERFLDAEEEDGNEWIEMYEFKSASIAKAYYKVWKKDSEAYIDTCKDEIKLLKKILKRYKDELKSDEIDELEDEIKDWEDELEEEEEMLKASGCSGKMVWKASSERAVKDTK